MQTTEFFAKFVGYGVQIEDGDKQLASLDLIARCVSINSKDGFVVVSDVRLSEFMAALDRHKGRLQQLNGVRVRLGRFEKDTSGSGFALKDRITGGTIHLREGGSLRELVTGVRRTYRLLQNYIEPCFKIASSIERLPYQDYITAIERDGHATVHAYGTARFCMGKIDYRAAHRVAKVHFTEDERRVSKSRNCNTEPTASPATLRW